ncbi:redoxin family protein [Nitrosospira sp. NRS527]|uniref:redoxin family protein n=1 Tax=Nitrosospira sp. NRS527 TaxID=155925 RepID=UPI001AF3D478|nr:redoxin family protein [Nitrosospira sp. NRS527]BCT68045.1 hypothetical protein NNRS527_01637 [Nitrosospira sp. NRS527]
MFLSLPQIKESIYLLVPQAVRYKFVLIVSHAEFKRNRVGVYGLSSQTPEAQKEAAIRLELSYPLLSDSMYSFSSAMELPMLEVAGLKLIKRLTLIVKDGVVRKCFYPVFPPDKNVDEVSAWLSETKRNLS